MPQNPKLQSLDIPGLNRLWDSIQVVLELVGHDSDSWLYSTLSLLSADTSIELCRRLDPSQVEREEAADGSHS